MPASVAMLQLSLFHSARMGKALDLAVLEVVWSSLVHYWNRHRAQGGTDYYRLLKPHDLPHKTLSSCTLMLVGVEELLCRDESHHKVH